ncbi:Dcp1p-Dcp2p decapping enzyme complex alpha subunit [Paramarasmius palmivorus]|uniref:Dcp1p-Dcp2p decapping enzyme complex alpha subunit n=1 Tax=Paramarasmius palmivorus TaxID=297713 RepID=A0AAW0DTV5_9AGAR
MKLSGEQYDDRIIEVHWDPNVSRWRMMRFRNDKPNGNHINVVEKIIDSIADGVDKDTLLSRCNAIRVAWKTRQGQPVTQEPHTNPRPAHNPPAKRPLLSTHAEIRFGPIQSSIWSKVSGPEIVAGFQR